MESWKRIELDGVWLNYDVSTHGRVRHHVTHHIKSQNETGSGYKIVHIYLPHVGKARVIQVP